MRRTLYSTTQLSKLFDVTETTIKRWTNEGMITCVKTPGGHRKYSVGDILDFANRYGLKPSRALIYENGDTRAGDIQLAVMNRDMEKLRDRYVERALSMNASDLTYFLHYLHRHNFQPWEIYDQVICPALETIGIMWERQEVGVAGEHHASSGTLDALSRLQSTISTKPLIGRKVVLASLGNEPHDLGLRCISYMFESQGWDVHFIGGRTPLQSFLRLIQDMQPHTVCLSATLTDDPGRVMAQYAATVDIARAIGSSLLVGGRAFSRKRDNLREETVHCESAHDVWRWMSGGRKGTMHAKNREET